MTLVICPGIHDPALTQAFCQGLNAASALPENSLTQGPETTFRKPMILPPQIPVYSPNHVLRFLQQHYQSEPLLLLCFSAGVVGGIGAARQWQQQGGTIRALIAIDGWGVPLLSNFPIHRLSHDPFTHWSSRLLGAGEESFYADPGVEHLALWRSPQNAQGWRVQGDQRQRTTAAAFLNLLLKRYGE